MQLRMQTADKENNPRGINRHKFSIAEAEEALQQPVVQALLDLCKFRNSHPAFNGKVCAAPRPPQAAPHTLLGQPPRSAAALCMLPQGHAARVMPGQALQSCRRRVLSTICGNSLSGSQGPPGPVLQSTIWRRMLLLFHYLPIRGV